MKKANSIRALLIALMLCLTFAIPLTASAQVQRHVLETDAAESTIVAADAASPTISSESEDPLTNYHPAKELSVSRDPGDCYLPIDYSENTDKEDTVAAAHATETQAPTAPSGCSYCGSQYHSHNYCAQRSVDNGAVGRWSIPSVGVNVATYFYNSWADDLYIAQAIVDAPDSAILQEWNSVQVIGDHANQGFNAIKSCSVGSKAYMDYGTYTQEYVCVEIATGYNPPSGDMTDENGVSIWDRNAGGITCYTCNGNYYVTLVFFQPVYE